MSTPHHHHVFTSSSSSTTRFLLFQFALPAFQILFFTLAIGGDPIGLEVGVFSPETDLSYLPTFYTTTSNPSNLDVAGVGAGFDQFCDQLFDAGATNFFREEDPVAFSRQILYRLDGDAISVEEYTNLEEALRDLERGKLWGVIEMGEHFSWYLMQRVIHGSRSDEKTLNESSVRVHLDTSNQINSLSISRGISKAFEGFANDVFPKRNLSTKALTPIEMLGASLHEGGGEPSFTIYMTPGIIMTIIFFVAIGLTSLALVVERKEGLFDRVWVSGVGHGEILLSHITTQFAVMLVQVTLLLVISILLFKIPCVGPIEQAFALILLQGLCGMCFGFLISVMCKDETQAIFLTVAIIYPILVLSGIIWPLEAMPTWLRYFCVTIPSTYAAASMRDIMSRGWDFTAPSVWRGFLVTSIWIVLLLIAVLFVQLIIDQPRRRRRHQRTKTTSSTSSSSSTSSQPTLSTTSIASRTVPTCPHSSSSLPQHHNHHRHQCQNGTWNCPHQPHSIMTHDYGLPPPSLSHRPSCRIHPSHSLVHSSHLPSHRSHSISHSSQHPSHRSHSSQVPSHRSHSISHSSHLPPTAQLAEPVTCLLATSRLASLHLTPPPPPDRVYLEVTGVTNDYDVVDGPACNGGVVGKWESCHPTNGSPNLSEHSTISTAIHTDSGAD